MSDQAPHEQSTDPGADPRGPFQPTTLPDGKLRWWVPAGLVVVLALVALIATLGATAYRAAHATCLATSNRFPEPRGWIRTSDNTFRRGRTIGTISRIGVLPPVDLKHVVLQREPDFTQRYDAIVKRQRVDVHGVEPYFIAEAEPLKGRIGAIWGFDYPSDRGRRIRIDHIMHPARGGCGWLFRAEFQKADWDTEHQRASYFPDRFDFDA